MTGMSEPAVLASDADRDSAAQVLNEAFADGRLTAGEHGERVHAVFAARTWPELAQLTADLPGRAGLAASETATDWVARLDPCLLCLLICCCPPAGIALLVRRRRARAGMAQRAEDR
jgi:Domain of unknown function (DUF1707)